MQEQGKQFTSYVVTIVNGNVEDIDAERWEKRYRYSQFLELHDYLKKTHNNLITKPFPEKTYITDKTNRDIVEWRRYLLQNYFGEVINRSSLRNDTKVQSFFFS